MGQHQYEIYQRFLSNIQLVVVKLLKSSNQFLTCRSMICMALLQLLEKGAIWRAKQLANS